MSTAPGIFTKIIRPLVAHWHEKGIQICVYLDDGAGIENDLHKAKNHSEFVKKSLSSAGFIINTEKSVWEPLEKITWLGLTLDCKNNFVFVTEQRINSITSLLQNFLHKPYTSARKLAKLSGKIVSTKFVLGDIITLKTRKTYELIEKRSSWDSTFNILNFPKVHDELIFWDKELKALNKRILDKVSDTVVVYSDASDIGIGACILNTNI